jgi:hypothetical protein
MLKMGAICTKYLQVYIRLKRKFCIPFICFGFVFGPFDHYLILVSIRLINSFCPFIMKEEIEDFKA